MTPAGQLALSNPGYGGSDLLQQQQDETEEAKRKREQQQQQAKMASYSPAGQMLASFGVLGI